MGYQNTKRSVQSHAKENICLGNEHGGSGDDYLHRLCTEQQLIQRHGQRQQHAQTTTLEDNRRLEAAVSQNLSAVQSGELPA